MKCPACTQEVTPGQSEYLMPFNGWTYAVCKPCYVAWLKSRVRSGERLEMKDLWKIGPVRQ